MTPFGWSIIFITVAAGLLTWWILSQDEKDGQNKNDK